MAGLRRTRAHEYTVIDLFAGCGGLSAGLRNTGRFRTLAAVETNVFAAATYALNFGEQHVYAGDIVEWLEGVIPNADVVVGGPPCQGFSALGTRNSRDPRNALWRRYVDTLCRARPLVFVLENVPQFLQSGQYKALLRETGAKGRLAGYQIEAHVLNSVNFGVAQARRRAVVIGRPRGTDPFGEPPHSDRRLALEDVLCNVDAYVSAVSLPQSTVEVFGRAVPGPYKTSELHVTRQPTKLSERRYRAIPPGGNRHNMPDELSTPGWRRHNSGAGDVMGRLVWSRPSVTIRTEFFKPEKGRYLHPDEHRAITHYEAALIQGFPEQYLWCGTKADIARQIGNAVPVGLATAIGTHIADALDKFPPAIKAK